MQRLSSIQKRLRPAHLTLCFTVTLVLPVAVACLGDLPKSAASMDQVALGRMRVVSQNCAGCHSRGKNDPSDPNWLSGFNAKLGATGEFTVGAFKTRAANLTPDDASGLGQFSERQLFNALRFGLDPADSPNAEITASTPGVGNFPANPHYLAPPMPWTALRHMPDEDIWAIVAYLKHGIKAVANEVPESDGPPDQWASNYDVSKIGPYPMAPFPLANEAFQQ